MASGPLGGPGGTLSKLQYSVLHLDAGRTSAIDDYLV